MNPHCDEYLNYREFLKGRYEILKASKPFFSARYLAKKSGISSSSYFRMVISGERKLSIESANKFAMGLSLSGREAKLLSKMVEYENSADNKQKFKLAEEIRNIRRSLERKEETLSSNHIEVLSDLGNLKIYLLAQSKHFKKDPIWIAKKFNGALSPKEIESRVNLLLKVGLWKIENGRIRTVAPSVKTGDCLDESYLANTHLNILKAAKEAISSQTAKQRVLGGRTFLFNKTRLQEVAKRIDEFKAELEVEFEDLNSTDVYELHVSFFEI